MGLLGPCEWPVLGYGENRSGNLDDASIKEGYSELPPRTYIAAGHRLAAQEF